MAFTPYQYLLSRFEYINCRTCPGLVP